jgi:hypothetical protein
MLDLFLLTTFGKKSKRHTTLPKGFFTEEYMRKNQFVIENFPACKGNINVLPVATLRDCLTGMSNKSIRIVSKEWTT